MSVELLQRDLLNRRLAEAHQDALAALLPRSSRPGRAALARQSVASALRALAVRLDPSVAESAPPFAVALMKSR